MGQHQICRYKKLYSRQYNFERDLFLYTVTDIFLYTVTDIFLYTVTEIGKTAYNGKKTM